MDYRDRRYYMVYIYNYWSINGIISLLKRIPSWKFHIHENEKGTLYVKVMVSYKFEDDKIFNEVKDYIKEKMPKQVKFELLSKENLGQ